MYVSVVGNLGGPPEKKQTKNGKEYLKLSIAESVGWGENKRTQWYSVSYYGKIPDFFYSLDKGDKIFVSGQADLGVWDNKPQCYISTNNVEVVNTKPKGTATQSRAPGAPNSTPAQSPAIDEW